MRRVIAITLLLLPLAASAQDKYIVDWDELRTETLDHLSALVRIDSSNPPGNETRVAHYVRDVLASEGIDSEMYALDPDRANLVARINGNGSKRPILIMGHTDVVGVQEDQWSVAPFDAIRRDGFIYGRGTLDDKDTVTAGLMVMMLLKRHGVELDRDIIFLAESGEEGTPDVGINFMVEHHWDKIAAEYCLAEGGSNLEIENRVAVVGIQTTEKMPRRAKLIARGTAGHGSLPRTDNAVTLLAAAVARAGAWQTPMRLNVTTEAYFDRLAAISDGDDAYRYGNISDPRRQDEIQQYFLENDLYHYSVLRTSVVPTMINAGFRNNVVPSQAEAMLDIRMLPDEDVDGFYRELAAVIDDPRIEIEPEVIYRPAAPPSDIDNEMFRVIEKIALQIHPEAAVLPTMSTGASDMAQVRAMGTQSYGIGATWTIEERDSGHGAHGDDERISEDAMMDFVRFLWLTIVEIAASK